jgi:ubiquinone/menaquinone biosynthesis C-methylase UbiE
MSHRSTLGKGSRFVDQYNHYAAFYDRSGQMRFGVLMDLYLRDLLRTHHVPGMTLLDLACGTGTLALLMAERGWNAIGLDRSAAMLREARRKLAEAGDVPVRFVEGDMRDFTIPTPVDLVTCCYDTLNYLIEKPDLQRCFQSVAGVLKPDGLFCFDLATDYFLRHHWNGVDVEEFDGWTQIMHSHYDEATGLSTLKLTGFVRQRNGLYRRFDETHIERAYPDQTIRDLLYTAGFAVEAVYDCFTTQPPNDRSLRVMYVARRKH